MIINSLKNLIVEARACQRCYPDYEIYIPLPDPKNSDAKAEVVFINERPGRIGTGESGYVSFDNDDPSANFFRERFEISGLNRENVFITNACLCHPVFEGYTDTRPKVKEMKNCHYWLQRQLQITQPKLIITIGKVAWESVLRYFGLWSDYRKTKFLDLVGTLVTDTTPWIYPLSHTSRLGRVSRKAEIQKADWAKIPGIMNSLYNL